MNRISETFKKKANECYKECKGDCVVEKGSSVRRFVYCDFCKKLKSPGNLKAKPIKKKEGGSKTILKKSPGKELEKPDYSIKKFKYPYLLASYPFFKDSSKFYKLSVGKLKGEEQLINYAYSMEGEYKISSYRNPKLMDIKVLLVNIYLSDYFKSRRYKISVKDFLERLNLESTGHYRNEILKSLHFLKNTTFITPIIDFNTGKKYGIHEWSILSEFKFHDEKRRKYHFEILLGDSFYKNMQKDYTLIELKKVLNLSKIALNLFLYLKTQNPFNLYKYPKDWELLKIHIGITTKNITRSKQIFEKAWSDIKSKGLLKGYRHSEFFISKKDNREKIKFSKQRELIP